MTGTYQQLSILTTSRIRLLISTAELSKIMCKATFEVGTFTYTRHDSAKLPASNATHSAIIDERYLFSVVGKIDGRAVLEE